MKIEYRKIDSLTPYERNPRIHSDTQIKRIAESIRQFGWTQPIVIDGDSVILAGHGRHAAAKLLDMVQVPCVLADDLTPAQRKAYRVIDNKLTTDSVWDDENLQAELNDLVELDFAVGDFGLDDLMEQPEPSEDEFDQDADRIETTIKLGDIIKLGNHTIFCADSLKFDYSSVPKSSVVITDPPYGVDVNYNADFDDSVEYLEALCSSALTKCLEFDSVIWFGAASMLCQQLRMFAHEPERILIWYCKMSLAGTSANGMFFRWHPIFCWKLPKQNHNGPQWDVVEVVNEGRNDWYHPGTKPIKGISQLVSIFDPNVNVVDPFLGSGTTLIACEQLGRTCYGIELEPKYCQVIVNRYRKYCEVNGIEFVGTINDEYIV